jgi:hypothetical protein
VADADEQLRREHAPGRVDVVVVIHADLLDERLASGELEEHRGFGKRADDRDRRQEAAPEHRGVTVFRQTGGDLLDELALARSRRVVAVAGGEPAL